MNKKQKKILTRIIITIILTVALIFIPLAGIPRLIAYVAVYAVIGYDIVIKAAKGIINGRVFDENFLMTIATLGAFFLGIWSGSGDYREAIAVMLFYQIGELFQSCAVGRSRRSISELMDIRPDYANIETEGGRLTRVDPDDVAVGTVIIVQPGEKVPIDGIIEQGASMLNTAALTGESLPREVSQGDEIYSGSINMNSVLWVRTTREFGESTASKILDLVENASSNKSGTENFISRFAAVYTPIVCVAALLLAAGIPLLRLILGLGGDWEIWIYRGLTFLVVSCPCAFVISIPLSFFAGLGCAGREGVLIKGSNYLEALSKTTVMVFDKTGTLTKGSFEVTQVYSKGITISCREKGECENNEDVSSEDGSRDGGNSEHKNKNTVHNITINADKLIELAALSECASSHPISKSLQKAYGKEIDRSRVSDIREISGHGVTAVVSDMSSADGIRVAAGSSRFMDTLGAAYEAADAAGTVIYVAANGRYAGYIVIADAVKETSAGAISALRASGVKKTVMLTGDVQTAADKAGNELGIDEIYAGLLPAQKVEIVEKLLAGMGSSQGARRRADSTAHGTGSGEINAACGTGGGEVNAACGTGSGEVNAACGTGGRAVNTDSTAHGTDRRAVGDKLAFVGDGINDAPVLARADIGIAMGALGSDAAIEAADVVLMHDDPMQIVKAIRISRKCIRIVYENIIFSLAVKIGCLALTAFGVTNMWAAIFADVGVMVICVLNAIRALRHPRFKSSSAAFSGSGTS